MSVRVMSWVWEHSRADSTDVFVLLAIADCANDAGSEAYPSMAKLVKKTRLHERSVQRSLKRLVELGELVIYPNAGPKGCNRYRIRMSTPGDTPPPAESHPRHSATPADDHPGAVSRNPRHSATQTIHEPSVTTSSSEKPAKVEVHRPDVEKICAHLVDRIVGNGCKTPTITAKWRTEARLLLDKDGRTVDQVIKAIDWCQDDPFWRANVLSMPKLREKYEQLRLAAQRGTAPNGRTAPASTAPTTIPTEERCPEHRDQRADNCAHCLARVIGKPQGVIQ